jgi:hypothetical protein
MGIFYRLFRKKIRNENTKFPKELVVYRETKPGIPPLLLEGVLDRNLNIICRNVSMNTKFAQFIRKIIAGYDEDCLSGVIGIVYEVPNEKFDRLIKNWAFNKLFDYFRNFPGTWDNDYKGETSYTGFVHDFKLHKIIPP